MQHRSTDKIYKYVTAVGAGNALLFIFVLCTILVIFSYPSMIVNGLHFFSSITWNPHLSGEVTTVNGIKTIAGASYGMGVFAVGTLISSALALLLGVPIGLGIAIFLSHTAPKKVAAPISFLVEMMAGLPSVIYGFWGFIVLGPFLLNVVEPELAAHLSFIPFFSPPVYGFGILTSGIILALMIVPIIASISRDAMLRTPGELKEGAKALGLTKWEITRNIVFTFARTSIIGSIILGLGRALGETMAVAMVAGGAVNYLPHTFFYSTNTIAAFMALSMDSAFTDPSGMFVSALVELALVLLIITTTVNVIARALVKQGFISSETVMKI